jgi:hypothetical protein
MDDPLSLVIPILAIVLSFGFAGLFLWIVSRGQLREQEMRHQQRMAALEKGIVLPEPPAETAPAGTPVAPANALKMGIFWVCVGLGLILTVRIVAPGSAHWAWGILVAALGCSDLFYWFAHGRAEWQAAQRRARGTHDGSAS